MRLLPIVLLIAVVVYALIDCAGTPKDRVPGGLPKGVWIALIILLPGLGAVVWIVLSRVVAADAATPAPGPAPWTPPAAPRRPPSRPMAPDDDPAFLARLEAERRRANRATRRPQDGATPGQPDGTSGNGTDGAGGSTTTGGGSPADGSTATDGGTATDGSTPTGGGSGTGASDDVAPPTRGTDRPEDGLDADRDDSPDDDPASGDDRRA